MDFPHLHGPPLSPPRASILASPPVPRGGARCHGAPTATRAAATGQRGWRRHGRRRIRPCRRCCRAAFSGAAQGSQCCLRRRRLRQGAPASATMGIGVGVGVSYKELPHLPPELLGARRRQMRRATTTACHAALCSAATPTFPLLRAATAAAHSALCLAATANSPMHRAATAASRTVPCSAATTSPVHRAATAASRAVPCLAATTSPLRRAATAASRVALCSGRRRPAPPLFPSWSCFPSLFHRDICGREQLG